MIKIYKASKGQLKHREIFDDIKKKIDNGEWKEGKAGNDSNLLIVFYVQIMPDDFVMQLHRF